MSVVDLAELVTAVEREFARAAAGLRRWDDPHPPPDRVVADDEYSRLTDPGRWRIVGARADAWVAALVGASVATASTGSTHRWTASSMPTPTREQVVLPVVARGLRLVVAHSSLGDVDDAGLVLGVVDERDRAAVITWFPDCGCDACDSGSQDEIDRLDEHVVAVVSGTFRLLDRTHRSRQQRIMVLGPDGWEARNLPGRHPRALVASILDDPALWDEWSGPSWLTGR